VSVVETAAIDPDDDLRPRRVERFPLEVLDRLPANLPVQVTSARTCLESGERRLVRGAPGRDDEAASPRGAGGAERDRLRRAADDDTSRDPASQLDLAVEEHRPLGVGSGAA
jgi:hypothetical protein